MIRSLITLCGASALLLVLGCGQKGPLFLPPAQTQAASSEPQSDADPQSGAETEAERPE